MSDRDLEVSFDELLDEIYEPFVIGDMTFYASDILKSCDPVAYRIGLSEHEDYMVENDEFDDDFHEATAVADREIEDRP